MRAAESHQDRMAGALKTDQDNGDPVSNFAAQMLIHGWLKELADFIESEQGILIP
jgi:hypothetical protein